MKLRLPSDLEGGLGIFAIIIGVTVIELYLAKRMALAASSIIPPGSFSLNPPKVSSDEFDSCSKAGGRWRGNVDSSEGCCEEPTEPSLTNVDICTPPDIREVCSGDPSSALCKGAAYKT